MGHTQADLDTATRHVTEGEARIRRVEGLIAHHTPGSEGAALAHKLLMNMHDCLSIMREHKAHIEAELKPRRISN